MGISDTLRSEHPFKTEILKMTNIKIIMIALTCLIGHFPSGNFENDPMTASEYNVLVYKLVKNISKSEL